MDDRILVVRNLHVSFSSPRGTIYALNGINLDFKTEECVGLIGETGSGKSMTALAILGLIPMSSATVSGEILFEGKNLLTFSEKGMRRVRGSKISMIFQEPMTSLNPVLTVGYQIGEVLMLHQKLPNEDI